jgi:hypothetical protein
VIAEPSLPIEAAIERSKIKLDGVRAHPSKHAFSSRIG